MQNRNTPSKRAAPAAPKQPAAAKPSATPGKPASRGRPATAKRPAARKQPTAPKQPAALGKSAAPSGLPPQRVRHDTLFKRAMGIDPRPFLMRHLRKGFREQVDFRVKPVDITTELVDDANRPLRCDAVFEVALKRRVKARNGKMVRDRAIVMLEHKSKADWKTALQVAAYKMALLKLLAERDTKEGRGIPGSLPQFEVLVVYNGKAKWCAPTSVQAATRHPDMSVSPEAPVPEYTLVDLGRIPVEQLADDRRMWAMLTALRFARRGSEGLAYVARISKSLADNKDLHGITMTYIMHNWNVSQKEWEVLHDLIESNRPDWEGVKTVTTVAKELYKRGKAEGEAKGKAEGKAEMFMRLLGQRFGDLPKQVTARIAKAPAKDLDKWGDRVLDAKSLEAVFGGSRHSGG